jgi:beta-lactam-binding protein with PASTA domain/tRNA A-37 threonylcarbamoyl transferase component Bud32
VLAFGEDQVGRVLGGRYRLVAPVGTGASATVFVADDVQLRRRVACKLLHPSLADDPAFLKRFRAEAQAAAALSHPNIMAVYDWGQEGEGPGSTPFLVLEYLAGGSLRAMLDRGRRLSPSQSLLVGLEAARGLDYAHRRGLVHRDVKPANLLFGDDRRLRIADFGLARAIAEAAWTEPAGVVLGTARYASPEQAKGNTVDGKSDVYSLSLSLVEAVTGQVPFAADTTVATLMNRLDKLMPVSAELGPLAPVLERAGRPDPVERFDAGELARALVQAAERLPRPQPLALVPTVAAHRHDDTLLAGVPDARAGIPGVPGVGGTTGARTATVPRPPTPIPTPGAGVPLTPAPPTAPRNPVRVGATAGNGTPPPAVLTRPPTLFDQDDKGPRRRLRGYVLALAALVAAALVATAVLVYVRSRTPAYAVKRLVGIPEAQALNLISENGWKVQTRRQRTDARPAGYVFDQSPKDGELKKGDPFLLYVSAGPVLHALPDITGKPQAAAAAMIKQRKLKWAVAAEQYDEKAPKGTVLTWSVGTPPVVKPVGRQVPTGTPVNAVVSNGPAPRAVPGVVGFFLGDVMRALSKEQLKVKRLADKFSARVPAGSVISMDPGPGAKVPRGSTVTVVVSKGPEFFPTPDVRGQNLAQAKATLAKLGLVLDGVAGPTNKKVTASSPPAGSPVKRGTRVALLFG